MTERWIARDDRVFPDDPDLPDTLPDIAEFTAKPTKDEQTGMWYGEGAKDLPRDSYPQVKPGQCWREFEWHYDEKEQGE